MKCIHLSDLHLGKRVNGFSMLDDQRDILEKILKSAHETGVKQKNIAEEINSENPFSKPKTDKSEMITRF